MLCVYVAMAATLFTCKEIRLEAMIVEIFLFALIIPGSLLAEWDLVCYVSFLKHLQSSPGMSGQCLRECV